MDTLDLALKDALAHARGERSRPKWDVPTPKVIKALRQRLEMSQAQFASVYGINLDSLKSWESGRAVPEQPNCLLIGIIDYDPERAADLFREVETHQALRRD